MHIAPKYRINNSVFGRPVLGRFSVSVGRVLSNIVYESIRVVLELHSESRDRCFSVGYKISREDAGWISY